MESYGMHIIDYLVLTAVILSSLGIGLFYSLRQSTVEEYINAKHQMKLLPVGMSIAVTFVSASSVQGLIAEVYLYGVQITVCFIGLLLGILLINITFVPLFFHLKPTTVYQYLEDRFNSKLPRNIGLILSIIKSTLFIGVILFGPASALEHLSGVSAEYFMLVIVTVCTVYTAIGGIQGVIWTDLFQGAIMILGLLILIFTSIIHTESTSIGHQLSKYHRLSVATSLAPTQRLSLWICTGGYVIRAVAMFSDQAAMMRYTGLPTLKKARLSTFLSGVFHVFLEGLTTIVGVLVFVYYSSKGCGPLESGKITSPNEIISRFVVDVLKYPGIAGIFVSVIVAGTMSTVSSLQNATTVMLWKDLLYPLFPNISQFKEKILLKLLVVAFGVIVLVVGVCAMHLDGTFTQIIASLFGATEAPVLGMFVLGACFTFTSSVAVVIGCLCSTAFCIWLAVGQMIHGNTWDKPPMIYETCNQSFNEAFGQTHYGLNMTIANSPTQMFLETDVTDPMMKYFYSISPFMFHTIGLFVSFVVGLILSCLPRLKHKEKVNSNLLFKIPSIRQIFPVSKNHQDDKNKDNADDEKLQMKSLDNCE